MKIELFAAEPQLASPVAICLDEQGRVYAAEEYRFNRGTEENRTRPFFLEDDLQIETLEDRLAMYKKYADRFEGGMKWFTKYTDQVRLLEDRNGDGRADFSSVFATNFNEPLDGLAAGLIARDGDVYFTCIPNLWRLRDNNGDGVADVREVVQRGFGVNAAFLGHDLHGLVWGPDGKLYFSVGDRGFHLTNKEGNLLHGPRNGAVFRCNADGSELEVVHRGLRNPQELAFDQFGNLFAVDNNCDKGDHSRLVYVVEEGNSGWNMAYQTIPAPYLTGPWHAENIWHLEHEDQPAWIVPPVGKLGAGPSGFTYYPGTGLPARYDNHFFLCNYTGNGGIESFAVRPKGAGFETYDEHDFFKPISATDADFGYDGKMYVSDFVGLKWDGGSVGGRIYTLFDPELVQSDVVQNVAELFRNGFANLTTADLASLLSHEDMRVRLRAQFALAKRGPAAMGTFEQTAESSKSLLARLHGIWGLGQIPGQERRVERFLLHLLSDAEPEVRANAAKVLGWRSSTLSPEAAQFLLPLLNDSSPRVRFFATETLGKLKSEQAVEPIVEMLAENADRDKYLRHAGVIALWRIGRIDAVLKHATDDNRSVRMAVLLVLRRIRDPRIALFLGDTEMQLATEAARAINDVPIAEATKALGHRIDSLQAIAGKQPISDALARRVINANFRIGEDDNAEAVTSLAASVEMPQHVRSAAIDALLQWSEPTKRDLVNGYWRPLPIREPSIVRNAVAKQLTDILANTPGPLLTKVVELVLKTGVETESSTFLGWVNDTSRDDSTRVAALRLLDARQDAKLNKTLSMALAGHSPLLRAEARDIIADKDPTRGLKLVQGLLDSAEGHRVEKQRALQTLGNMKSNEASEQLQMVASKLAEGEQPPELHLDIIEAVEANGQSALKKSGGNVSRPTS